MADHYQASIDALTDVNLYCDELDLADAAEAGREVIGRIHRKLGVSMKIAAIHAQLANAQEIGDLYNLIDERLSDLRNDLRLEVRRAQERRLHEEP